MIEPTRCGLGKVGSVAGIALCAHAQCGNLLLGLLAVLVNDQVGKRDVGAFGGKFQCDSLANATCGTGDQGDFSF